MLKVHIRPGLGKRKVAALAYSDVDDLHRDITKHSGPYRANRVIALVSKLCSLAVRWRWRADNPCRGIERHTEDPRKRYLAGAELERLSKALAEHDDQDAADIFRLLLLTGTRRGEILAARRANFDLQRGLWTWCRSNETPGKANGRTEAGSHRNNIVGDSMDTWNLGGRGS